MSNLVFEFVSSDKIMLIEIDNFEKAKEVVNEIVGLTLNGYSELNTLKAVYSNFDHYSKLNNNSFPKYFKELNVSVNNEYYKAYIIK